MEKYENVSGSGKDKFTTDSRVEIQIHTVDSFTAFVNDLIVGPMSNDARYLKLIMEKGDSFELLTAGRYNYQLKPLPERGEVNTGKSLVKEGEEPLTLYDKLKGEMLAIIATNAQKRDLDTIEEDNDFEMDDDLDNLTQYEKIVMKEEYLSQNSIPQNIADDVKKASKELEDSQARRDSDAEEIPPQKEAKKTA